MRVYVDDLIVIGSKTEGIEKFKAKMKLKFDMGDIGSLSSY